jgi:dTDP-4-dehydrorhamnose reductase
MKIIILGSNGMLGNYVKKILEKDYEILEITRDKFDIINEWNKNKNYKLYKIKLEEILKLNKEDYIINCIGKIPQKSFDIGRDINEYILINTLFPIILNEISMKNENKMIHITTDCVFSGEKGLYDEDDNSDTTKLYGITKSISDNINCCIIRTSIIGEELHYKKSLLEWIKKNKNGEINGYTNHLWNGITCLTLAKIIKIMIDKNIYWNGIRHIYSNIVSKYEICNYINEIYKLNIKIKEKEDIEKKDMTLKSKYKNEIMEIKSIKEQIIELEKFNII